MPSLSSHLVPPKSAKPNRALIIIIIINSTNFKAGIFSHKLAWFIAKYLQINMSGFKDPDTNNTTLEQFEQSILDGGIIQPDGNIEQKTNI